MAEGGSIRGLAAWLARRLLPALLPALVMATLLLPAGCGRSEMWYRDGHSQADFDRDWQSCAPVAADLARRASLTGDRREPRVYVDALRQCLHRQGWSNIPPEERRAAAAAMATEPMAVFESREIRGFGRRLAVPPGFTLLADTGKLVGPTATQTMVLGGPGGTIINVIFQRALRDAFEVVPYPVAAPFFLYARAPGEKRRDPRWAAFAGLFQGEWVGGFGAYLWVSRHQRITVVITRELPPPAAEPPPGLRLAANQYRAMEQLLQFALEQPAIGECCHLVGNTLTLKQED